MKYQETFNKVIGKESCGEIVVLDYIFDDGDGFKGAVGSMFDVVSKAQYDYEMDKENVIARIIDSGVLEDVTCDTEDYIVNEKAELYYADIVNSGEIEELLYDLSYDAMHDEIREVYGLSEEDYPMITCVGGGRMFDKGFFDYFEPIEGVEELIQKIKAVEGIE